MSDVVTWRTPAVRLGLMFIRRCFKKHLEWQIALGLAETQGFKLDMEMLRAFDEESARIRQAATEAASRQVKYRVDFLDRFVGYVEPTYRGGAGVQTSDLQFKTQAPIGSIAEYVQRLKDERCCKQVIVPDQDD